jgi:cell division septation protein DedD
MATPSPRREADRRARADQDAPWLAEATRDDGPTHTLVGQRTLWRLILGLALLVMGVVAGVMLVAGREEGAIDVPAPGAEIPVLRAPGPWKVPADGPGTEGEPVEGQGRILFGTGEGLDPDGRIALEALPEDPLPKPGTEMAAVEAAVADAAPADPEPLPAKIAPKPVAPAPAGPGPPPASAGGRTLQLGAFSSQARARAAWTALAGRFAYLDGLEPLIAPVERDGRTLHRLRVTTSGPSEARDLCGRLKVAGESCSIVD